MSYLVGKIGVSLHNLYANKRHEKAVSVESRFLTVIPIEDIPANALVVILQKRSCDYIVASLKTVMGLSELGIDLVKTINNILNIENVETIQNIQTIQTVNTIDKIDTINDVTISPMVKTLVNGDFKRGLFGWETIGGAGISLDTENYVTEPQSVKMLGGISQTLLTPLRTSWLNELSFMMMVNDTSNTLTVEVYYIDGDVESADFTNTQTSYFEHKTLDMSTLSDKYVRTITFITSDAYVWLDSIYLLF